MESQITRRQEMNGKITRFFRSFHRNESGITGLETAIILIAFVTVASVLAYTVLSAGIFSSERGKETVYKGLESAQSTLEIKGSVLGISDNRTELNKVQFNIGLTIANQVVDARTIVCNYFDDSVHVEGLSANVTISGGSTERGSVGVIEADEVHVITINIPTSANVTTYKTFTVQLVPPTGASITVRRTLPGTLKSVMDLN
jgi:archaeal flagellin FlaB